MPNQNRLRELGRWTFQEIQEIPTSSNFRITDESWKHLPHCNTGVVQNQDFTCFFFPQDSANPRLVELGAYGARSQLHRPWRLWCFQKGILYVVDLHGLDTFKLQAWTLFQDVQWFFLLGNIIRNRCPEKHQNHQNWSDRQWMLPLVSSLHQAELHCRAAGCSNISVSNNHGKERAPWTWSGVTWPTAWVCHDWSPRLKATFPRNTVRWWTMM